MDPTLPIELEQAIVLWADMLTLISYAYTNTNNLLWVTNHLKLKKDEETTIYFDGYFYVFRPGTFSFSCYQKEVREGRNHNLNILYTLVSKFSGRTQTLFDFEVERYMKTETKEVIKYENGDSEVWMIVPDDWFSERKTINGNKVVVERQRLIYEDHCEADGFHGYRKNLCKGENCVTCSRIYSAVSKRWASKCIPRKCASCDFQGCICDFNPKNNAILTCIDRETLVNGVHPPYAIAWREAAA